MKASGLFGAIIGGVIGMVAWALVAILTEREIGLVAWAIGGVVGFGAVLLGGRGSAMAVAAAVIALASIFCGKVAATYMVISSEKQKRAANITEEEFEEALINAEAFSKVESDDQHRAYMVDRGFIKVQDPEDVTRAQLENFRRINVPVLHRVHADSPDLEGYREIVCDHAFGDLSPVALTLENLSLIDAIFALLGIATAYGLVMRAGPPEEEEGVAAA